MDNKQDKGFTLVELLIVIVILGILATVTVFAVRGITDRGQENACDVDQRTLDTSIEAFYAQYQRDPANEGELVNGINGDGPVLKEAPTNFAFVPAVTTVGSEAPATYAATSTCGGTACAPPLPDSSLTNHTT
jgi:prepilin-type N-terminal cleavage/methylation domain-containing protein